MSRKPARARGMVCAAWVALTAAVQGCGGASPTTGSEHPRNVGTERAAPIAHVERADLPHTPSREHVVQMMGSIQGRMVACARGRHGMLTSSIELASDGTVTGAMIDGSLSDGTRLAGSADEACFLVALRSLRFDPFARPTFRINYPFRF